MILPFARRRASSADLASRGRRRLAAQLGSRPNAEVLEDRQLLTAIALADQYRLLQDTPLSVTSTGVLANDIAASGNPLAVSAFSQPAHGTLAMAANGTFTYTPTAGYSGPDIFAYTATDGLGQTANAGVTLNVVACSPMACVSAEPRLASLDTSQSALLNGILSGLTGSNLNLTVLDSNGLAQGQLNGGDLVAALQTQLGVATPAEALNANVTLAQIDTAAATAAQAEGNTALATIFNNLAVQVGGLNGTIQLGNLLQVNPNDGSLADASLNALDLVTGSAQLFNFNNVATTPTPITISGAALGLGGVINSVQIQAQVVEPPVFVCGPVGTQFHSAAVRLALNLDLVDLTPDTTALTSALNAILPIGTSATASVALGQIQLYTEVASTQGTIAAIDAATRAVTLQATPGVANIYLGNIPDALFYDRTRVINPATDVGYGNIGALNLTLTTLGIPTTFNQSILARSVALGQAPLASTVTFTPPYPQSQTVGSSAAFISNFASSLATNLSLQFGGTLGPILDPLVNGTILPTLTPIVSNTLAPALGTILTGVVDPLLNQLGVGLGEEILTVSGESLNCPPQANDDLITTPAGVAAVVPVLGNDTGVTGDPLSVSAVVQPLHGTAVINADGTITYTPTPGYAGADTLSYTLRDAVNGQTSTATVAVQVTPAPPTAANDAFTTVQGTPLTVAAPGVLANDTAGTNGAFTAALVSNPAHGVVTFFADGSFTYTPTLGYSGPDSFSYRDIDATTQGNIATVSITVTPAAVDPTAPVAVDDAFAVTQGGSLMIAAPGVLANDTAGGRGIFSATPVTAPAHGILLLNPNGSFSYTPDAGFFGTDSFTYRDEDGGTPSNVATVRITVNPLAAPVAPTAVDDTYSTGSGSTLTLPAPGVLGNDTNPSGGTLSSIVVTGPAHGVLVLNANGSLSYTPTAGYFGPDSFTYRDQSNGLLGNIATVSIAVMQPAAQPVAVDDNLTAPNGGTLNLGAPGIIGNDSNPTGTALTPVVTSGPSHGTLTLNTDGSLSYTPVTGFVGTDSFTYRDRYGIALTNEATVSIFVPTAQVQQDAVPDGPIIISVSRIGYHSQPTGIVLSFDSALDPTQATNLANYSVAALNRRGQAMRSIALQSATYDPTLHTVTLFTRGRLPLSGLYQVTVPGSGTTTVTGANGLAIDGDRDGLPGGTFIARINRASLSGPSVPLTNLGAASTRLTLRANVPGGPSRLARIAAVRAARLERLAAIRAARLGR